jgi:WD40 repeat protein
MELVKGTPITEFADARQLTPQQRLEMFVPVCQAIQHAHMKGIIHRDIKPSNVLVALHDEMPVPKVIDFGVAKAVGQQLTEKTIYTGFGALVGTPAYMAPEQATFNQLDIDTRADVYSLGVLLYELLAGSPPIEAERMKKAALDEVLRIVRDEEPQRPSQRLSTSQMKASIAATRQSDPVKLSQLMQGEIDWIVMKALEKDRTRRYDTANGLASDVQRYLCGEQVQAVPPSLGYRLRKAYRRNRMAVRVVVAFVLMLLTGVAMATVLAIQARRAEAMAEAKRIEAEEQTEIAKKQEDRATKLSSLHLEAMFEAKLQAASSRIDADLLEYHNDPRLGLLRLARPLDSSTGWIELGESIDGGVMRMGGSIEDNPNFVKLREFQTAAVISAGQEFVPLVPPVEVVHDIDHFPGQISPDHRYFITRDERPGHELLAIPSLARLGVLREGTERVMTFGFSPDSKTIYTQDHDSIVRFWNTDGTLRAKTPLRSERFIYPAGMQQYEIKQVAAAANPVLVADGIALLRSEQRVGVKPFKELKGRENYYGSSGKVGPAELYSTHTGKFLRRLDRPGHLMSGCYISPDKRWLIYKEEHEKGVAQVVIVATVDGRELARLDHPGPTGTLSYDVSPTGKWVLTFRSSSDAKRGTVKSELIRIWDTSSWKSVDHLIPLEEFNIDIENGLSFVSDEVIGHFWHLFTDGTEECVFRIGRPQSWVSLRTLGLRNGGDEQVITGELGGTILRSGRTLVDANKLQRLKPPLGRKYHPRLAELAPDGRFWEGLDTATERDLPYPHTGSYLPSFGRVEVRRYTHDEELRRFDDTELRILPDAKRLDLPPEMVELWAQVVVGGEISADGTFEPWDQPTWTTKQQELAAMKPPYADFPFPGWAATEPHLWYRIRANEPTAGSRDKYLKEWQRLTGRTRPDLGPDTWRTPEVAPMPEEPKSP